MKSAVDWGMDVDWVGGRRRLWYLESHTMLVVGFFFSYDFDKLDG